MASLFRSQKMKYCHLVCNDDSAWEILNELGDQSSVHFIDPDPSVALISRPFANYIKRCEEVQTKLSFIEENAVKFEQNIKQCDDYPELMEHFKRILSNRQAREGKKDGKTYFFDLEQEVSEQQQWLEEQIQNFENLSERQNQLKEYHAVLKNAKDIVGNHFFRQEQAQGNADITGFNMEQILESRIGVNQIVGVIDSSEVLRFQRMIFRVTKGNAFTDFKDIDWYGAPLIDPHTMKPVDKKVFVIIYPGGTMDIIKNKLNRICDSFNCSKYGFPQSQEIFVQKLNELGEQTKDAQSLVEMTKNNLLEFFKQWTKIREGANCSKVAEYTLYTIKEKGIYHTLNMLDTTQKVYKGYCWVPKSELENVNLTLQELGRRNPDLGGGQIKKEKKPGNHISTPPTYFRLNEFTEVFQLITNTYGTPRYKEINPGLFSLMTFPFLFGVMFGDIAHGGLLFLFGLFLVLANDKLKKTPMAAFGMTRYFVMFMGFFALYCGFLYNDFTSLSFNFFGSCYDASKFEPCPGEVGGRDECFPYKEGVYSMNTRKSDDGETLSYPVLDKCTYPFGVDPIWAIAENNISFMNSYKMKMAVIFGVLQMSVGICLKGWNAINFRQPLDFVFEFLPQITFMTLTFGYMDFMIVYKWFINFQGGLNMYAPSIITLLINMPLKMGSPGDLVLYGDVMIGADGEENTGGKQQQIQFMFLIIALICIPIMLIPKPIIVNYQHNQKKAQNSKVFQGSQDTSRDAPLLENDYSANNFNIQGKASETGLEKDLEAHQQKEENQVAHHDDDHGFGDFFVHQVIETIEFVLGSISNTASYLRLWALSLAHSQLADVFFANGIQPFLESGGVGGAIGLLFGFYVFALITFGVLMCMDVMECFLHALRLHWVEFQNKFYKADGVPFEPFCFKTILQSHNVSSD